MFRSSRIKNLLFCVAWVVWGQYCNSLARFLKAKFQGNSIMILCTVTYWYPLAKQWTRSADDLPFAESPALSSDGSKHKTWSIFWSGRRYLKWNLTWAGRQPLCLFNQGSLPLPCLCESLIQQSSPYFAAVHSSLVLSHDAISDSLWCVQIQQTMCQSARI